MKIRASGRDTAEGAEPLAPAQSLLFHLPLRLDNIIRIRSKTEEQEPFFSWMRNDRKSSAFSCFPSVHMQGKAPQEEAINSARLLHPPLSSPTLRKQTSPKNIHQPCIFICCPLRRNLRLTRSEAMKFHGTFAKFNTIHTLRDFSQPFAPISARSTLNLSPCDFKPLYDTQGARP